MRLHDSDVTHLEELAFSHSTELARFLGLFPALNSLTLAYIDDDGLNGLHCLTSSSAGLPALVTISIDTWTARITDRTLVEMVKSRRIQHFDAFNSLQGDHQGPGFRPDHPSRLVDTPRHRAEGYCEG